MTLRVEGIWKSYGDHAVLRGVDLEIGSGEIYCLLGPNGSGKSTTLHIVAGLLPADRGQVLHEGQPLSDANRARLGFLPQGTALYPRLSCVETLRFFAGIYGVPTEDLHDRVETTIQATGLEPYRRTRAEALSGGWRQRLSLASSIVHRPNLLVLDEPTTGLDAEVRIQTWRLINSLADQGTSVFLTSHHLDEIEAHCHRVGILRGGQISNEGSPEELRRLIPAVEIAEIDLDDPPALLEVSREHGWSVQRRQDRWLLYLGNQMTLQELAQELSGLSLRSLSLRSVTLEDAFLKVTNDPESLAKVQ